MTPKRELLRDDQDQLVHVAEGNPTKFGAVAEYILRVLRDPSTALQTWAW
jgi:hypothetical protein